MKFLEAYNEYKEVEAKDDRPKQLTFAIIADYSDPNYYRNLRNTLGSILKYEDIDKFPKKTVSTLAPIRNPGLPTISYQSDYNEFYKVILISKGTVPEDKQFRSFMCGTQSKLKDNLKIIHIQDETLKFTQLQKLAVDFCDTKYIQFIKLHDQISLKLLHEIFFINDLDYDKILYGPTCMTPEVVLKICQIDYINDHWNTAMRKITEGEFTEIDAFRMYSCDESNALQMICRGIGRLGLTYLRRYHKYSVQNINELLLFGYVNTENGHVSTFKFPSVMSTLDNTKFVATHPREEYETDSVEYAKLFPDMYKTIWNTNLMKIVYDKIQSLDLHVNGEYNLLVTFLARKILSEGEIRPWLYYTPYYYHHDTDVHVESDSIKVNEFIEDKPEVPTLDTLDNMSLDDIL